MPAILALSAASCFNQDKTAKETLIHSDLQLSKPALGSWGFDVTAIDSTIKPGDDFFLYANGNWIKRT
jgi:putative endopeptidase